MHMVTLAALSPAPCVPSSWGSQRQPGLLLLNRPLILWPARCPGQTPTFPLPPRASGVPGCRPASRPPWGPACPRSMVTPCLSQPFHLAALSRPILTLFQLCVPGAPRPALCVCSHICRLRVTGPVLEPGVPMAGLGRSQTHGRSQMTPQETDRRCRRGWDRGCVTCWEPRGRSLGVLLEWGVLSGDGGGRAMRGRLGAGGCPEAVLPSRQGPRRGYPGGALCHGGGAARLASLPPDSPASRPHTSGHGSRG